MLTVYVCVHYGVVFSAPTTHMLLWWYLQWQDSAEDVRSPTNALLCGLKAQLLIKVLRAQWRAPVFFSV